MLFHKYQNILWQHQEKFITPYSQNEIDRFQCVQGSHYSSTIDTKALFSENFTLFTECLPKKCQMFHDNKAQAN